MLRLVFIMTAVTGLSCRAIAQKEFKPTLYVVAIGISNYSKYPEAELKYAHKDAVDLVECFKKSKLYKSVESYVLTDETATRESILSVKQQLLNTSVDDHVIVSFSGHGILDKDLNFYFSTYNIDLEHLASTGLTFDELEFLLDSIPSRKKIFLIDACYSGEADKEEAKKIIDAGPGRNSLAIGGKPLRPHRSVSRESQSAFELMKELFVNLNRRTGATVISSSSGVELSFEKDKWKNGLFTYSILKALIDESEADLNGDGVFVSELFPFVQNLVREYSNGLQVPQIREENVEFDYRIW